MARTDASSVLGHLCNLVDGRTLADAPDQLLLEQYVHGRDQTAFHVLLLRHGPMVLNVCRRVLRQTQDAEEAFQATFLVLASKPQAIHKRESVGCWLYGVAYRIAQKLRVQAARRRARERLAAQAVSQAPAAAAWRELQDLLDDELGRLPQRYRWPLVLCYLQGKTQEEAADQLGCPLGTIRSRLARGRALLHDRLTRRGLTLSGAALATALTAQAVTAAVPAGLLAETAQAAGQLAAGQRLAGAASPAVAALVRTGFAGLAAPLKSLAWLALAVSVAVGGVVVLMVHRAGETPPPPKTAAIAPAPPATEEKPAPADKGAADPLPPGAVARLGTMRFRHEGWVKQFVLSPDDETLAVHAGKSLSLWDTATGRLRRRFVLPDEIQGVAYAPDGKLLAAGCQDCIVRLLDPAAGTQGRQLHGHQPGAEGFSRGILDVAFSLDGSTLTSWGSDKTTRIWETSSGKELRLLDKDYRACAVTADCRLEAQAVEGDPRTLRLWDVQANREVRRLVHEEAVGRARFSPDGKTLAVAVGALEAPCKIVLWNVASGKRSAVLAGHTARVFDLVFSPAGRALASCGYDATIRLWDLDTGKERNPAQRLPTPVYQVAFTRDGNTLISRGAENRVRLWDVVSWRERVPADGPDHAVGALAFAPDGRVLAVGAGRTVWLWDTITGKKQHQLEGHKGHEPFVRFSAGGRSLVTWNVDGTVRVWETASGKEQRRVLGPESGFGRAALAPDGVTLALHLDDTSNVVYLWDAGTGKEIRRLDVRAEQAGVRATISRLCFAPDGKTLFAASGTHLGILRWEVATGKVLASLGPHDGGLSDIALAADGRSIAAVTLDGSLYLWELASGQTRLVTKNAGYATVVAFSPDGSRLAAANNGRHRRQSGDKVIHQDANREEVCLLDASDGTVLRRFAGHAGGAACLVFAPDGRTLASGGQDTTVILWATTVPKAAVTLAADDLDARWAGLRGDAAPSYRNMTALAAAPAQTMRLFRDRLKPITAVDAERLAALVVKLNSEKFAVREAARHELTSLGDAAEPALRQARDGTLPIEALRRIEQILDKLASSAERSRNLRAVEVLERIGDADARALLRRLAEGAPGAWLTEEASQTLRRLEHRQAQTDKSAQ